MSPGDAYRVLTLAATYDGRTLPQEDADAMAVAWAAVMQGVRFEDAQEAVVWYYARETRWIKPADILRRVKAIREERAKPLAMLDRPRELADRPQDEIAWTKFVRDALVDGAEVGEAVNAAARRFGLVAIEAGE